MNKTPADAIFHMIENEAMTYGEHYAREACRKFIMKKTYSGQMKTPRTHIPKSWIEKAWSKQHGRCKRCGGELLLSDATGDHVIPLAKGGVHKARNIHALCAKCNSEKGARTLIEDSKFTGQTALEALSND